MSDVGFDWDPRKDATNRRKHGVSFQEAVSVFVDEHALWIPDPAIPATRSVSFSSESVPACGPLLSVTVCVIAEM